MTDPVQLDAAQMPPVDEHDLVLIPQLELTDDDELADVEPAEPDADPEGRGVELPHTLEATQVPTTIAPRPMKMTLRAGDGVTVAPMKGKNFPAKGFTRGRKKKVRLVVMHTAEGSTTNESLGGYFMHTTAGSSNAGIDNGSYALFVAFSNTPWTNPPVNEESDTVEMCGFRAWSRAQWLAHPQMLELAAHFIAWRCAVRRIPIRLITGAQAHAGLAGVLDHKRVNDGYGKSDHTDVGAGFPWDLVLDHAQQLGKVAPPPQPKVPAAKRLDGSKPDDRWLGLYNPPLRGKDVMNIQNALRGLGNDIPMNGIYDQRVADLVAVFQQHRGIKERGVGPKTWAEFHKHP